jgi:hypothetical protein
MRSNLTDASLRLRDVAQGDQENSRVRIVKRCIEISQRPALVSQHVR